MKYNIQPSYKVTDKGTIPAEDARTITNEDGAVIGTAMFNNWNSTAAITIFTKNGNSEIKYLPCESPDQLDEVIRKVL
ncbi:hypothetical protein [Corynebacterium accolens]|uniref:hypothetical protein n=1 Tax=Corynebacterium accolens TaxID=38284 RepID=UPI00254DF684|nr:hypothetical protein [Corynebacterium accolens]MDK8469849.1 hypothetical protein [Corynebacterium accolens]